MIHTLGPFNDLGDIIKDNNFVVVDTSSLIGNVIDYNDDNTNTKGSLDSNLQGTYLNSDYTHHPNTAIPPPVLNRIKITKTTTSPNSKSNKNNTFNGNKSNVERERLDGKDVSEVFIETWKTFDGKFDKEAKLQEMQVLVAQGLISQDVFDRLVKLTAFEELRRQKQQRDAELTNMGFGRRIINRFKHFVDRSNAKIQEMYQEHVLKGGIDITQKDEKPVIEGYLYKRAVGSGKNWKKRYILCFPHRIEYYRSKSDLTVPLGTMWLTSNFYVADSNTRHLKNSKLFGFMVSDFDRTYYFAAVDQAEKDYWMHSLACVIRRLQIEDSYNDDRPVLMGKPLRTNSDADKELAARLEAYKKSMISSSLDIGDRKASRTSKRLSAKIKSAIRNSVKLTGMAILNTFGSQSATDRSNENNDNSEFASNQASRAHNAIYSNVELESMRQKIVCEVMLGGIQQADNVVKEVDKKLEEKGKLLTPVDKREYEEIRKQALQTKEVASQILTDSSAALAQVEEVKIAMDQKAAEEVILLAMESELEKLNQDNEEMLERHLDDHQLHGQIEDILKSKAEIAAEEVLKKVEIEEANKRRSVAKTIKLLQKTIAQEEELEAKSMTRRLSALGLFNTIPSASTMSTTETGLSASPHKLPMGIPGSAQPLPVLATTVTASPSSVIDTELEELHQKRSDLEFQARLLENEVEKMHLLKIVAEKALYDASGGKRASFRSNALRSTAQDSTTSDISRRIQENVRMVSQAIFNPSLLSGITSSNILHAPLLSSSNSHAVASNLTSNTNGSREPAKFARYQNLIQILVKHGRLVNDEYEMPFGELFDIYTNRYGNIGPILIQAKKEKVVDYKGDMLFRNYHGNTLVKLIIQPEI